MPDEASYSDDPHSLRVIVQRVQGTTGTAYRLVAYGDRDHYCTPEFPTLAGGPRNDFDHLRPRCCPDKRAADEARIDANVALAPTAHCSPEKTRSDSFTCESAQIADIHLKLSCQILQHPLARFGVALKQIPDLRF